MDKTININLLSTKWAREGVAKQRKAAAVVAKPKGLAPLAAGGISNDEFCKLLTCFVNAARADSGA